MNDVLNLLRENIKSLTPYRSARSEGQLWAGSVWEANLVKLDANESPWDWVEERPRYNRYPDSESSELLERLAEIYSVDPNQILLTRGIDEGLDLLIRAFCEPQRDSVAFPNPTYGYYEVAASIQGARIIKVPLKADFSLDPEVFLSAIDPSVKLVIICNPNNPTGNGFSQNVIESIAERLEGRCLLVVDEAYIEFSDRKSSTILLNRFPHLLVLRTFSKAWALAGARLGVVLGHAEVLRVLKKVIAPYPISAPSLDLLQKVISGEEISKVFSSVESIKSLRTQLEEHLRKVPGIQKIFPSETNFLLLKVDRADIWHTELLNRGIRIRNRDSEISGCLRVTIGSPTDTARLLEALEEISA